MLTDGKRRLFCGPKIVIAGMTQRIEAAWDPGGLALGVQVFAAAELAGRSPVPVGAAELKIAFVPVSRAISSQAIVGGLSGDQQESARPASDSHRAGGRPGGGSDPQQLERCVQRLERLTNETADTAAPTAQARGRISALERQIDACVYRLYRLTSEEIDKVEAEFSSPP